MEHAALVHPRTISAAVGRVRTGTAMLSKRTGALGGRGAAGRPAQRPRSRDRSHHRRPLPDREIAVHAAGPDVHCLFSGQESSRRLLVADRRLFDSSPDGNLRRRGRRADPVRVSFSRAAQNRGSRPGISVVAFPASDERPFAACPRSLPGGAGLPRLLPGDHLALVGMGWEPSRLSSS